MRKHFVWIVIVGLLSGCLFEPENKGKGQEGVQEGRNVSGLLSMEDIYGADPKAYLFGFFLAGSGSIQKVDSFRALLRTRSSQVCRSKQTAVVAASQASVVSAGKMLFGPAKAANLDEIPEDNQHLYYKELKKGYPAGDYQIQVQGKEPVHGFGIGSWTAPEILKSVSVNGQKVDGNQVEISLQSDLQVEWEAPAFENEYDRMLVILVGIEGSKQTTVTCQMNESDATEMESGNLGWEIPQSEFAALSPTAQGSLTIARGQVHGGKVENTVVNFQSLRTWETPAKILP